MRFNKRGILLKGEKRLERKKMYLREPLYSGVFGSSLDPRSLIDRPGAIITSIGISRIRLVATKSLLERRQIIRNFRLIDKVFAYCMAMLGRLVKTSRLGKFCDYAKIYLDFKKTPPLGRFFH